MDDATSAVAAGWVDLAFGADHPPTPIPRAADAALLVPATERFSMAMPAGRPAQESPSSLRDVSDEPWILPPAHTSHGRAIRSACRRRTSSPGWTTP